MDDFKCRDNEKMLKKLFKINLLVAWCVHKQTATNLIEPKMWPLLWMEWQEILHEVGHLHLVRTIRGWHGSASGTERSHAIHGSTSGTPWPCQTRTPCHPWMVRAIRGWHESASGTEQLSSPEKLVQWVCSQASMIGMIDPPAGRCSCVPHHQSLLFIAV